MAAAGQVGASVAATLVENSSADPTFNVDTASGISIRPLGAACSVTHVLKLRRRDLRSGRVGAMADSYINAASGPGGAKGPDSAGVRWTCD
jgi:hypothetical protein